MRYWINIDDYLLMREVKPLLAGVGDFLFVYNGIIDKSARYS